MNVPSIRRLSLLTAVALLGALLPQAVLATPPSLVVNTAADTYADDGSCSLREAVDASATQTASGLTVGECPAGNGADVIGFSVAGPIVLTEGSISFGSPVTIDGGLSGMTINGGGQQILWVQPLVSGAVTLRNLTLAGGQSTRGAAIRALGPTVIEDSVIGGNLADEQGGAIYGAAPVTVTRVLFRGNHAGTDGGAIAMVDNQPLVITDSTFGEFSKGGSNTASGSGGAIWTNGDLTISGTTIAYNGASGGDGGGIHAVAGTTSLTGGQISHNYTNTGRGAGIRLAAGSLVVDGTAFDFNDAVMEAGGGISVAAGASATVTNANIQGNMATWGGGIDAMGSLTLSHSLLSYNAAGDGAGVLVRGAQASATISTTTFSNQNGTGNGAGLEVNGAVATVTECTFDSNATSGVGGGIDVAWGSVDVASSTFTNNLASSGGSGMAARVAAVAHVTDSSFSGGTTGGGWGAGVQISSGSEAVIQRSYFTDNSAPKGGAISNAGSLELANSTLYANEGNDGTGGGIISTGVLHLTNDTIVGNISQSADGGGGVMVVTGVAIVRNTVAVGNTALIVGTSNITGTLTPGSTSNVLDLPPGTTLGDLLADVGPASNGGTTLNIAIAPGSPLFDAGDSAACAAWPVSGLDQRGVPRTSPCDIGAVEMPNGQGPVANAPAVVLKGSGALAGTSAPILVTLTGAPVPGGNAIESWNLQKRLNNGSWTDVPGVSVAPSITVLVPAGSKVEFRARAVGTGSVTGPWSAASTAITPSLVQQTAATVVYKGTWANASATTYSGGSVKWSSGAGASATFTFTGRGVALVSALAPARGKARIYVDGALAATVDLKGTTAGRKVVWSYGWGASGRHTVKVVVLATAGRPRVDVDAFVVLK